MLTTTMSRFQMTLLALAASASAKDYAHIVDVHQIRSLQSESAGNVFGQEAQYEIRVNPFQIHLQYDDSEAMSSNEEMIVLGTTQGYLSKILQTSQPKFSRLALFQFVRDCQEAESEHFAKVALGGTAFFSSRSVPAEDVQLGIMLSFVGENMYTFVSALQEAGLTHVVNATLMSIEGIEMDYQDGKMTPMGDPGDDIEAEELESDRDMGDDMRMMTILLSLLIPGAAICVACSVYAWRSVREINWKAPKTTPEAPIWQSSAHLQVKQTSIKLDKSKKSREEKIEEGLP